jgi:hypothetical protein
MKQTYFSHIRNPMTIIALFVGLTEIGLGVAFPKAPEHLQGAFLCIMASLAFLNTIGFFLLLFFRPSHFYGPGDFRSDQTYLAAAQGKAFSGRLVEITEQTEKQNLEPPSIGVLKVMVDHLHDPFCWYLLKVANRPLSGDEHTRILFAEYGLGSPDDRSFVAPTVWQSFLAFTLGLKGLLFELLLEEDLLTFQISAEVLDLLMRKLHPETADDQEC